MTLSGCQNEGFSQDETSYYEITTSFGTMIVELYDETPGHRDNFRKLVADGFYDGTTFHRVIPGFMIQGGDPNSKDDDPNNDGLGGPGYTIPAEFNPNYFHKKGALAAARTPTGPTNPNSESSGSQFYIIEGRVFPDDVLDQMEAQKRQTLSPEYRIKPEAREIYTTRGGYPPLDMEYTVFGEIITGFDVLDKIVGVDTPKKLGQFPATDRPIQNVTMTIKPLYDYSPE